MKPWVAVRISWLVILVFGFSGVMWAQEAQSAAKASVDQEKEEQDAKEKAKKEAEEAKRAEKLGIFSEVRNNATLSFGVSENYDSNFFGSPDKKQGASYTLLYPRFFGNLERSTVALTVDYRGGYRIYNRFSELNGADQFGSLDFRYEPSTRSTFHVADQINYSPLNTQVPSGQALLPGTGSPLAPLVILFNNQSVLRNTIEAGWTYLVSGPTSLHFHGGYDTIRYRDLANQNTDNFNAGFELKHQATRKLAIQTEYSFLYSQFNNEFVDSKVNRMGLGFTYDWRPGLSIYAFGGPETSTVLKTTHLDGYVRAGVSRTARATTFSAEYQRSVANNSGFATPLSSQSVGIDLGRTFAGRVVVGMGGLYFWSSPVLSSSTHINGFQAGPRLIYKIRPSMAFTMNYYYVRQTSGATVLGPPNITRHFISCGFEYRLPPLLHR